MLAFLGFGAVSVLLQTLAGAYVSDFSGYPDEPAHYVTGLMVRDYLATFPWRAPMAFAEDFYRHYPMVAIGHWPPAFYAVQAIWMLIFGASRTAMLVLMALISAATVTVLFHGLRARFGMAAAAALALAFLATPVVQEYSRVVMAEMLVALFIMLAVYAYKRYLETAQWRNALQFGLLSAAAILTKPNGLALALLPVGAVIAMRRFDLVTRFSFWLPAIVVLGLCGPWYVLTADWAREGWSASYSPSWLLREPASSNAVLLIGLAGPAVFVLALVGLVSELWPRRSNVEAESAVLGALLISVWVFHSFVAPVREERHLIPAIPALLTFAACAVFATAGAIGAAPTVQRSAAMAFAGITAVVFLLAGSRSESKPRMGLDAAVQQVLVQANTSEPVLVSSESYGEAVFIAELAGRERRLGHRVLRASKVLSSSNWNGSHYQLLHRTTEAVDVHLAAMHVTTVVLDTWSSPVSAQVPHHRQLLEVIRNSDRWRRLDSQAPDTRFQVFQAATAR